MAEIYFSKFIAVFIPLFIAIDGFGILPIFFHLTEDMTSDERNRIALSSVFTGFVLAISFMVLGDLIFQLLGITVADFMVAGGILLLVISVNDIVKGSGFKETGKKTLGVVPIGTPLITGPATLTTCLVLVSKYGYLLVSISLLINLAILYFIFRYSEIVKKFAGVDGLKGLGKIISLLLAAIAVKFIREGLLSFFP